MSKTKLKEEEPVSPKSSGADNKLELLKWTADIDSKINKQIRTDFTLAKLNETDKVGAIEMTCNAYYSRKLISLIARKATKWVWNKERDVWVREMASKEEKQEIEDVGDVVFTTYMNKVFMTVILNRNVKDNYLLKMLAGANKEEDEEQGEQLSNIKAGVKELVKNEEMKQGGMNG